MKYHNPIEPGFYPDPSICRVGDEYYRVNSTFEYLPGIPIFHSKDLINWKQIGHCITRPSQMVFTKVKSSGGLFAPTIRYHKGIYYVACTVVGAEKNGNFYVTSSDPAGEWSDPIWVDQTGIDPSFLFDDDGSVYFTSNCTAKKLGSENITSAIQQSKINIETGKFETTPRIICYGTGGRCAEGPHLYKINGWYYLLLAEGGTEMGHMVTVFRSSSPWGPFEPGPNNPILTARDEADSELCGTGHGDLIEDKNGNWWIIFLCYRFGVRKYHHIGRETALMPVVWENGWPVVVGGKVPSSQVNLPQLEEVKQEKEFGELFQDDFSAEKLGFLWNFIRNYFDGWSLKEPKGALTIYGKKEILSEQTCPAFIGRRQCHMHMECEVEIEFEPNEGEEAGLTILCSNQAHYDLFVGRKHGKKMLQLHKKVEDMETWTNAVALSESQKIVTLWIEADKEQYRFGYLDVTEEKSDENGEKKYNKKYNKKCIGTGLTKLLSTEVNWGFTGVYIGMYVSGNGKQCEKGAHFRKFRYHGIED